MGRQAKRSYFPCLLLPISHGDGESVVVMGGVMRGVKGGGEGRNEGFAAQGCNGDGNYITTIQYNKTNRAQQLHHMSSKNCLIRENY